MQYWNGGLEKRDALEVGQGLCGAHWAKRGVCESGKRDGSSAWQLGVNLKDVLAFVVSMVIISKPPSSFLALISQLGIFQLWLLQLFTLFLETNVLDIFVVDFASEGSIRIVLHAEKLLRVQTWEYG